MCLRASVLCVAAGKGFVSAFSFSCLSEPFFVYGRPSGCRPLGVPNCQQHKSKISALSTLSA